MRYILIIVSLITTVINAVPQLLDISELEAVPKAPHTNVPPGAGSQALKFNLAKISADTYTAVIADPADLTPTNIIGRWLDRTLKSRANTQCTALPQGHGPVPATDTPEDFLASGELSTLAKNVRVPNGWLQTYQDLKGATSTQAYMGYSTYESYDPAQCASDCAAKPGCLAFNIFYERAPTVSPGPSCPDPSSTTLIKCSFWGTTIEPETVTNTGQWMQSFRVAIAGSNGYRLAKPLFAIAGYTSTFLNNSTINAPADCGSYMTVKMFNDGQPFDPARCAAACKAETDYNLKHRPKEGICQFFSTYLILKNSISQCQVCALYKSVWDASFATNTGYSAGPDVYTHQYVYSHSNNTYYGADNCTPADPTSTTTSTTASATPSSATAESCAQIGSSYTATNGKSFDVSCTALQNGSPVTSDTAPNFQVCLERCSQDSRCVVMDYNRESKVCYLLESASAPDGQYPQFDSARLRG